MKTSGLVIGIVFAVYFLNEPVTAEPEPSFVMDTEADTRYDWVVSGQPIYFAKGEVLHNMYNELPKDFNFHVVNGRVGIWAGKKYLIHNRKTNFEKKNHE